MQTTSDHRVLRQVHAGLTQLLDGQGPFLEPAQGKFQGAAAGFAFECGVKDACKAWLTPEARGIALHLSQSHGESIFTLPGLRTARFVYAGTRAIGPSWPMGTAEPQALASIGLMGETADGQALPIDSVTVWKRQPVTCDFDMIVGDCRR